MINQSNPTIEIICVTYKQHGSLSVLVQSFLNQTNPDWRLHVIHDGYDESFLQQMQLYSENDGRIKFSWTETRSNDWGHTLRDEGLKASNGDYILITNGDNYYVPKFIDFIHREIADHDPDVVLYDMIHSHDLPGGRNIPSYSLFETQFSRFNIDMGAAVVKGNLARTAGFRDRTHDADATYFEDVAAAKQGVLKIAKVNRVLFVHN